MNNNFALYVLVQIYEFMKERPGFNNKAELDRVIEYFQALHEGAKDEFRYSTPNKILGKFGIKEVIHLKLVPQFADKRQFIEWVHEQLHNDQ